MVARNAWRAASMEDARTHALRSRTTGTGRASAASCVRMRAFGITGIPLRKCVHDNLFGEMGPSKRAARGRPLVLRSVSPSTLYNLALEKLPCPFRAKNMPARATAKRGRRRGERRRECLDYLTSARERHSLARARARALVDNAEKLFQTSNGSGLIRFPSIRKRRRR